jgi:hypothetical protein
VFALASSFVSAACYSTGEGAPPPGDRIYFPVGLALTGGVDERGSLEDARYLVVANSDFDLAFNAGTLSVFDLERVRAHIATPCATNDDCDPAGTGRSCDPAGLCVDAGGSPCRGLAVRSQADQLLHPGACEYLDPTHPPDQGESLILHNVQIGAFATDVIYRRNPFGGPEVGGRLFVPVRGDATVHWIDIGPDGSVDCGQPGENGACDDWHRAGNHADEENTRDLRLASEPFAIDATADGRVVVVTQQTSGAVSVLLNGWPGSDVAAAEPGLNLKYQVSGLPTRPVGVASVQTPLLLDFTNTEPLRAALGGETGSVQPGTAENSAGSPLTPPYAPPGFLVTYRDTAEVDLIHVYLDEPSEPERPYAAKTAAVPITLNALGTDSRGIALDDSSRAAAELACAEAQGLTPQCLRDPACAIEPSVRDALASCLSKADATPLDVFVANRAPATLLLGRTQPAINAGESSDLPQFYDSIPLTLGPSRVVVGRVIVGNEADGSPRYERRVFVVCFDSRRIFVYDPDRRRIDAEITTGRGPHALAIDEAHGLLFIGHFTDSFIGVVSLDRRFHSTYGKMLGGIGIPVAPRTSK